MMTSLRLPKPFEVLLFWHGLFAGSYIVAYLTAESANTLHLFSGYTAIGLLVFRLSVANLVSERNPWSLPLPRAAMWRAFLRRLGRADLSVFRGRTPLAPLSGLVILGAMVLVSLTGLIADWWKWEDLHEGVAEGSAAIILIHIAIVSVGPLFKKLDESGAAGSAGSLRHKA